MRLGSRWQNLNGKRPRPRLDKSNPVSIRRICTSSCINSFLTTGPAITSDTLHVHCLNSGSISCSRPVSTSIYLPIYLCDRSISIYLSIYLSIDLSIWLYRLAVYLSIRLFICLPISVLFSLSADLCAVRVYSIACNQYFPMHAIFITSKICSSRSSSTSTIVSILLPMCSKLVST